jgi:two-component system LytT family response regulator
MSTLEEQLDPSRFQRIHRSAIVRLDLIDAMHIGHGGHYTVQLRDGTRLKVSRSKRDELAERLKGG